MEFYFPLKDRMYHWVRSSSLYSPAARQRGITVKTMFRQEEIGASVPVFDRLETGFYFRKLHSLCLSAGVPYLVDLDDLIWDVPEFSVSSRIPPKYLLEFPESLMKGAAAITVSTPELKEQVEPRFPGKPVFLVENCLPAWVAPRAGVLIANTDAFKMGDDQVGWFIDLLRLIFRHGLSIQLLGDNQNLLDRCSDIVVHSLRWTDVWRSYLLNLAIVALPPRTHTGRTLQLCRLQVGHQGDRLRLAADTYRCQRYRSVSPLCRPARHQRLPRGAEHFRGLEAGGRDGDSADPRTGTPEGKGDQRHAQGNPRHSVSAVARCCRFPARP